MNTKAVSEQRASELVYGPKGEDGKRTGKSSARQVIDKMTDDYKSTVDFLHRYVGKLKQVLTASKHLGSLKDFREFMAQSRKECSLVEAGVTTADPSTRVVLDLNSTMQKGDDSQTLLYQYFYDARAAELQLEARFGVGAVVDATTHAGTEAAKAGAIHAETILKPLRETVEASSSTGKPDGKN